MNTSLFDYIFVRALSGEKYVEGVKTNRIYPVINAGVDWYLVKADGKPRYVSKIFCQKSSLDDFEAQDRRDDEELEEFDFYES